MGRHSSDSGDDYKPRRRRSRSRSDSRGKKQKKSKRNRSPPKGSNSGNSSRSVSRTHDRDDYRRSRSRSTSYSRSKGHRKERSHKKSSKTITKYRHSSPRSSSRRRSRSRNRDRSHSEHMSRSRNKDRSRRSRSANSPIVSSKPLNKGTQDTVSAAELAERKIQMALRAAAAADEALKAQGVLPASSSSQRLTSQSIADQQRRSAAIDSINNDQFVQNSFKSNRSEIPLPSDSQIDASHSGAMFSSARTSSLHLDGTSVKSEAITHLADKDSIMHPNLYIGVEEKMENWKLKVATWKKRKLMQSAGVRV